MAAITSSTSPQDHAPRKPRIFVLATGGTIAGVQEDPGRHGYTAGSFDIGALINAVPRLRYIADVQGEQLVNIGSQDMNDAVWLKLSQRLAELAAEPEVDAIVVTHGTDTLEETSFFIDLTMRSAKPVVFVGAMRPATAISADGPMNLFNAVAVAAHPQARDRGVLVVLNDTIMTARDAAKTHTSQVDAFQAPDRGPCGRVDQGQVAFLEEAGPSRRPAPFDVAVVDALPKVEIVYAHAGMGPDLIVAAVAAGARGLVLAGVGNGNMTQPAMNALADAAAQGVAVVRSTRLPQGAVVRNGEVDDDRLGFVVANIFKPGKARILLQLALLSTSDPARVQAIFDLH